MLRTIDRETGEVTEHEGELPVVELTGDTRIQIAIRELLRNEYDAAVKTYGTTVDATLEMTKARAKAVMDALFKDALRDLADDVKPRQTRMPV